MKGEEERYGLVVVEELKRELDVEDPGLSNARHDIDGTRVRVKKERRRKEKKAKTSNGRSCYATPHIYLRTYTQVHEHTHDPLYSSSPPP